MLGSINDSAGNNYRLFRSKKGPKASWSEEEQMELRRLCEEFKLRQENGEM